MGVHLRFSDCRGPGVSGRRPPSSQPGRGGPGRRDIASCGPQPAATPGNPGQAGETVRTTGRDRHIAFHLGGHRLHGPVLFPGPEPGVLAGRTGQGPWFWSGVSEPSPWAWPTFSCRPAAGRLGLGQILLFLGFGPFLSLGVHYALSGIFTPASALVGLPQALLLTAFMGAEPVSEPVPGRKKRPRKKSKARTSPDNSGRPCGPI